MKLTLVLLLVLGLSLCLAQDTNNTKKARPLVNKTDGNMTHPHHSRHPHPRPQHKQNETAPAEAEAEQEATNTTDATDATEEATRLLGGKRNAKHHEQKGHKEHKAPGKHLRGHHGKPAAEANVTKPAEPEENNESEEAQVNEEESVIAEQGEDAEELARLLADQKARNNKRGAQRRGHRNGRNGRNGNKRNDHQAVKPEEEVTENAEGVIGGEDAEDIESELRRLLPQVHQGNNKKKPAHAKKGGRPQWKKPSKVKPELKPEDFDFFGEHQIFGEDAFENGEDFGFGWKDHHKKH